MKVDSLRPKKRWTSLLENSPEKNGGLYSALGDGFKGQRVGSMDGGEAGTVIRSDSAWRVCGCGSAGDGIKAFPPGGDGVLDQRRW
uniref:Uncharacterized protein n=1 Tax=Romanomermis culicivorax TaxID=13658 RepID=A0A915IJY6_ROMCU